MKFHELSPSPNNTKVRMALRFKGIEFETVAVDPFDRGALLEITGQDGSPVIEDRGIVLPESEAILHYLDANYPDTPRLFPRGRPARRECESWQRELDEKVARPWFPIFLWTIGRRSELDPAAVAAFRESLEWLESEIGEKNEQIRGSERPICDLRVAQWATYALPGDGFRQRVPFIDRFEGAMKIEEEALARLRRFLRPWNECLA